MKGADFAWALRVSTLVPLALGVLVFAARGLKIAIYGGDLMRGYGIKIYLMLFYFIYSIAAMSLFGEARGESSGQGRLPNIQKLESSQRIHFWKFLNAI